MKEGYKTSLKPNRRKFIQYTGAMIGGVALQMGAVNAAFTSGNNTLRIGLIGCGGRGTGAASQALTADVDTVISAMGDVFATYSRRVWILRMIKTFW